MRTAGVEEQVLGAAMANERVRPEIMEMLSPECFKTPVNREVFTACYALDGVGMDADAVSVADHLSRQKKAPPDGGWIGYCGQLVRDCISPVAAIPAAKTLKRRAVTEQYLSVAREISSAAEEGDEERLSTALDKAVMIGHSQEEQDPSPGAAVTEWLDAFEERISSDDTIKGERTGLDDLDARLNGLRPGQLVVLAARPGMGKTAKALNVARRVAESGKVLFISCEMPRTELMDRVICATSGVAMDAITSGVVTEEELASVSDAAKKVTDSGLHIVDETISTVSDIRWRARKMALAGDLKLIVVDYIQLLQSEGRTRESAVSAVSRGLKILAKELSVPILALSQLNRELERREDKRPRLSDLRESGAIEQDADVILFLYRHGEYEEVHESFNTITELMIAKQRQGRKGTVLTAFFGATQRFGDVDRNWADEYWRAMRTGTRKKVNGEDLI